MPAFTVKIDPKPTGAFNPVRRVRDQRFAVKPQSVWRKGWQHRRLDISPVQRLGLNLSHFALDSYAGRSPFYQEQIAAPSRNQRTQPVIQPRRRRRLDGLGFPAIIQLPHQPVQFARLIHSRLPPLDAEEGSLAHSNPNVQQLPQCDANYAACVSRPGAASVCEEGLSGYPSERRIALPLHRSVFQYSRSVRLTM